MRLLFLGRKPAASDALRLIIDRGHEVVAVVAPFPGDPILDRFAFPPYLHETAKSFGIPVLRDEDIYRAINEEIPWLQKRLYQIDLVISFLFWKKIKSPLIELPRFGCFNFHPAPLPEFRGRRGYNYAILEGSASYGVSVHWVSESFDQGDLVKVSRFAIEPNETAFTLEQKSMEALIRLLDEFLSISESPEGIPRTPQGQGKSATKKEMLALAEVTSSDDAAIIDKKIRAFWCPPYSGAEILLAGKKYTLVNETILKELGRILRKRPDVGIKSPANET
jgi:methionyl-tRNA formyltransferase